MFKLDGNKLLCLLVSVVVAVFLFNYFMGGRAIQNEGELSLDVNVGKGETYRNSVGRAASLAGNADGYVPNSNQIMTNGPTDIGLTSAGMEKFSSPDGAYPRDTLNPEELLPQDNANQWASCNPAGLGALDGKNFLNSDHFTSINSVGQSLGKNANLQLRSEPPNPVVVVSPWMQATANIPDMSRRYLEVGSCQ